MTPIGRVSFVIDYFTILPQHNEYYTILLHHDKSRCALIDVTNVFIGPESDHWLPLSVIN